jgi:hypothetical protein
MSKFGGLFIPAPLVTIFAVGIGSYVALSRWLLVNDENREERVATLPQGFSALVASVASSSISFVFVTLVVFWDAGKTGLPHDLLHNVLIGFYTLFLFAGFAFAGLALRYTYQEAVRPLSIRFGATMVFILDLICVLKTIASFVGLLVS